MADLDTRSKRASSVQLVSPSRLALVLPDATLDQGDRQHSAWAYSGILAAAAATIFGDLTTLFAAYVIVLHDATPSQPDSDTLIRDDVTTMRAATNSPDDLNTAYAEYRS